MVSLLNSANINSDSNGCLAIIVILDQTLIGLEYFLYSADFELILLDLCFCLFFLKGEHLIVFCLVYNYSVFISRLYLSHQINWGGAFFLHLFYAYNHIYNNLFIRCFVKFVYKNQLDLLWNLESFYGGWFIQIFKLLI